MRKRAWLAASAKREEALEETSSLRSGAGLAGSPAEEPLELQVEELEARLAPGGTVLPKSSGVKPGKTAGWGC